MNPVTNPFAPGAGTPPPELAGRDELLEMIRIATERTRLNYPAKSVLGPDERHFYPGFPVVAMRDRGDEQFANCRLGVLVDTDATQPHNERV